MGAPRSTRRAGPVVYKTDPAKRLGAGAVDVLVGLIIAAFFLLVQQPYLSAGVLALYLLLRDALPIPLLGHRSVGKRALDLRVEQRASGEERPGVADSFKRNITLVPGILLAPLAVHLPAGVLLAVLLALAPFALETALIFTDPEGRRLGDKLANTRVLD